MTHLRLLTWLTGLLLFVSVVGVQAQTDDNAQSVGFLQARLDIGAAYVGQPVIYTVRVYLNTNITDADFRPPSFSGFGQSPNNIQPVRSNETINGVDYTVTTIETILYPLRAGDISIDPYIVEVPETTFRAREILQSNSVTVNVSQIPFDSPQSYRNAIGQYEMQVEVEPSAVELGQSFSFRLIIRGSGNVERLLPPPVNFNLPQSWRINEQAPAFQRDTVRFGTMIFEWIISPDTGGEYQTPPVEFSFLNPLSGQYERRRVAPQAISILAPSPTPTATPTLTPTPVTPTATPVPVQRQALRNAPDVALRPLPDSNQPIIPTQRFWWLWLIAPGVALLAAIMGISRHLVSVSVGTDDDAAPDRTISRIGSASLRQSGQRLKEARSLEPTNAYNEILNTILDFLSGKTGYVVTDANYQNAIANLPTGARNALEACIEEAMSGQYAPVSENDVTVLVSRTRQALREADRQW